MKSVFQTLFFLFLAKLVHGSVEDEALNVFGEPLQPCSSSGMVSSKCATAGISPRSMFVFNSRSRVIESNDPFFRMRRSHLNETVSTQALSGFTRTGYCVNQQDDLGSHHICIDLSSTTGGNFCSVTGQPDWCSSSMACHDKHQGGTCPVKNWCVCQWAFATYVRNAGGCNHIQSIKCDAVNQHALLAYKKDDHYKEAMDCIERKCGLM